jgi:hypothetical protein
MKRVGGSKLFVIDGKVTVHNLPNHDINFKVFLIFVGSQNSMQYYNPIKKFKFMPQSLNLVPVSIDYINIGDGLGIACFLGE